jgi:hypothetical protein
MLSTPAITKNRMAATKARVAAWLVAFILPSSEEMCFKDSPRKNRNAVTLMARPD